VPAESKLKRECRETVELGLDGRLIQVKVFSVNGFPDSILLVPGCPAIFIEFKALGKTPRTNQKRWGRLLGEAYWMIDNFEQFNECVGNLLLDHGTRKE
jgi:hypothetical protein